MLGVMFLVMSWPCLYSCVCHVRTDVRWNVYIYAIVMFVFMLFAIFVLCFANHIMWK